MRVAPFYSLVVMLLALVTLVTSAVPAVAQNADAELMARVIVQREDERPLAGPLDGTMIQSTQYANLGNAGVEVENFSAHVAFTNPSDGAPWDFGFDFGRVGETSQRIVVDSTAGWTYIPSSGTEPQSGPAPSLSPQPGARNTLDLLVQDNLAILNVSGVYVGSIHLTGPVVGEVSVTTGVFDSTTVEGREMPFTDFSVWELRSASAIPQAGPAPTSGSKAPVQQPPTVPSEGPVQTSPPSDQVMFEAISASQRTVTPLAGPIDDTLVEVANSLSGFGAGVMVDNFQASADFTVPSAGIANTPWDIGFIFGEQGAGSVRVVVDSLGSWHTSVGSDAPVDSGPITNLTTRPGDTNTLVLFVMGDQALLGVNGQFAARFVLPIMPDAGDVGVGVGFYSDQTVAGRVTAFQNFEVRPFDLGATAEPSSQQQPAAQAPAQAPTQSPAQEAVGTVDPETEALFAELLAELESTPPDQGPFASQLVERGDGRITRLAGEMTSRAANFAAMITLINPADMSTPWTAGFAFRANEQVVLAGTGHVIAVHPDGTTDVLGQAMTFDPTPGASNMLQVIAIEDTVLVGVNGELVATESLAGTDLEAGMGVALVAGIFPQDQRPNRAIPYENFLVWYLT